MLRKCLSISFVFLVHCASIFLEDFIVAAVIMSAIALGFALHPMLPTPTPTNLSIPFTIALLVVMY